MSLKRGWNRAVHMGTSQQVEDLWPHASAQHTATEHPFSLIVVTLFVMQDSSHLITTVGHYNHVDGQ
jgi:hypothetical protein